MPEAMPTLESIFPPLSRLEDSGDAPDANRLRLLNHLNQIGLPAGKHEEYRFTPVMRTLEKYADQLDWFPLSAATTRSVPNVSGAQVVIMIENGYPRIPENLPSGIRAITESQSVSNVPADGYACLNALLTPTSLVLESRSTEDLLVHLHYVTVAGSPVAVNPSVRILVRERAKLSVIETFENQADAFTFLNKSLSGELETGAELTTYTLQNITGQGTEIHHCNFRLAGSSTANSFVLTTEGNLVRNNPVYEICGTGAVANLYGLYLLDGKTLADNHTVVDHRTPDANSNELYKGVMAGHSRGVFNGKIFVRQDAQKTNAFQSNRNILLSDTATVNTKPQLEIWADDVKCSHGCTSGQLDEEALFYLRSRGIDKFSAQAMLLDAFTGDVLQHIPHEAIRELFREEALRKIASIR